MKKLIFFSIFTLALTFTAFGQESKLAVIDINGNTIATVADSKEAQKQLSPEKRTEQLKKEKKKLAYQRYLIRTRTSESRSLATMNRGNGKYGSMQAISKRIKEINGELKTLKEMKKKRKKKKSKE